MRRAHPLALYLCLVACSSPSPPADGGVVDSDSPDASGGGPAEFDYVPVEGTVCGNGSSAGMGVSPVDGASTLVVFFGGGGACWDPATCFGLNAAVHISTDYDAAVLDSDLAPLLASALLHRGGTSPIADASFAYLPYCTGDLHSGTVVRDVAFDLLGNTREVHHLGRRNAELFALDLARRFPSVETVVLVGFSAGGYGALLDADLFDAAFDHPVGVLADGSPFIQPSTYGAWRAQWQMVLPEGCAECETRFDAILAHRIEEGRRHGLITTTNDEVIRLFFGYGLEDISARTLALVDAQYRPSTTSNAWVVPGTEHVLLGGYATRTRASGASLKEWTDAFFDGGEAFQTLTP